MEGWTVTSKHGVTRKKNHKKHTENLVFKEPAVKRCLLVLDLNPFGSLVKGRHSKGR